MGPEREREREEYTGPETKRHPKPTPDAGGPKPAREW